MCGGYKHPQNLKIQAEKAGKKLFWNQLLESFSVGLKLPKLIANYQTNWYGLGHTLLVRKIVT